MSLSLEEFERLSGVTYFGPDLVSQSREL